jgi:hypothetical protein
VQEGCGGRSRGRGQPGVTVTMERMSVSFNESGWPRLVTVRAGAGF